MYASRYVGSYSRSIYRCLYYYNGMAAKFCRPDGGSFSKLSEEEIAYYIDKFQPMDKAGAYGVQEWIGFIGVENISEVIIILWGCRYNDFIRNLSGYKYFYIRAFTG